MVSLKYETENTNDCISMISGVDLCKWIKNTKIYIVIDAIVIFTLLIFRKKIISKQ